ncbi:MAG: protein kinase [Acidobacteriota bacterium]
MSSSETPIRQAFIPRDLPRDPELTYDPARSTESFQETLPTSFPTVRAGPQAGNSRADRSPLLLPASKPDLELTERLAQGGFGDVWTGVQTSLERTVVIKRLRHELLERVDEIGQRELVAMFHREALTTARLEHPNIVPIYQLAVDDSGQPLLGMKQVRGRPWNELLREDHKLAIDEILSRHLPILIDVAQAIAFAHSKGVLHRDLKPHQVMVGEFGEVQLMDWGLAATFPPPQNPPDLDNTRQPRPAEMMPEGSVSVSTPGPAGTPGFMAPEQTRYAPDELGPWTDLYLLGGSLYYILTGKPPHQSSDSTAAFKKASVGEVTAPRRLRADLRIPSELDELAMSVLQAEPHQRHPQSVQGLIEALEDYQTGASRRRRSRALTQEVDACPKTGEYLELNRRLAVLQEARALWADNPQAESLQHETVASYAETALDQSDLVLARLQVDQMKDGERKAILARRISDAEARRRGAARQRKLALLTIVVLVALILGGVIHYSLDQKRAQKQLTLQRDAARSARADAEDLMSFMLQDLWQSLWDIERVDLLAPVASRAETYYSRRSPSELTREERARRGEAFSTIGQTLHVQGEMEQAIAAQEKASQVFQRLMQEEPQEILHLSAFLDSQIQLGSTLNDIGDKAGATTVLRKALELGEQAMLRQPETIELQELMLAAQDFLGVVLYDSGALAEAQHAFESALRNGRALAETDLGLEASYDLNNTEMRLAVTLNDQGRGAEALSAIERAIAGIEAHRQRFPERAATMADLSFAMSVRGEILGSLGRHAEGAEALRSLTSELHRGVRRDPANAERRYVVADVELVLANLEEALGRTDAAASSRQRVVELLTPLRDKTDNLYLLDALTRALLALDRFEEARPLALRLLASQWTHRQFVELCRKHGITAPDATPSPGS